MVVLSEAVIRKPGLGVFKDNIELSMFPGEAVQLPLFRIPQIPFPYPGEIL